MVLLSKSVGIINDDIFVVIKDMLWDTQKDEAIYLVTPYVRFDEKIRDQIKEAAIRKAEVRLLTRKGEERNEEDSLFLANNRIEVRELSYLHAKVYLSKRVALVSSINLYDVSDKKNKEIAVALTSRAKIKEVREVVEKWWADGEPISAAQLAKTHTKPIPVNVQSSARVNLVANITLPEKGFCISGGQKCERITFDYDRPLCKKHWKLWKRSPKSYSGNYCHWCGERNMDGELHINHPLCSKHESIYRKIVESRHSLL